MLGCFSLPLSQEKIRHFLQCISQWNSINTSQFVKISYKINCQWNLIFHLVNKLRNGQGYFIWNHQLNGQVFCCINSTWNHLLNGQVSLCINSTWNHLLYGQVSLCINSTWNHLLNGQVSLWMNSTWKHLLHGHVSLYETLHRIICWIAKFPYI